MSRAPKKGPALQKHKNTMSLTTVINNKNEERFASLAAKNNLRLSNMVSLNLLCQTLVHNYSTSVLMCRHIVY